MDPFIGQLMCVGFNFTPRGWAQCNGQLMSIAENTALFSLLGTTYGGDGSTTFGLPDLRGRVPMSFGQGPGLSLYVQGQMGGTELVTLNGQQIPAHTHTVMGSNAEAGSTQPADAVPAAGGSYSTGTPNTPMSAAMIPPSGGGNAPHENRQPFTVLNWIIATEGIYPSRQ